MTQATPKMDIRASRIGKLFLDTSLGAEVEVEIVVEGNPEKLDAVVLINVDRSIARDMAQRTQNELNWDVRRITIYVPVLLK